MSRSARPPAEVDEKVPVIGTPVWRACPRPFGEVAARLVDAPDLVGRVGLAGGRAVEEAHQPANSSAVGVAPCRVISPFTHRPTPSQGRMADRSSSEFDRCSQVGSAGGQRAKEAVVQLARADLSLGVGLSLAGLEQPGEHLPEQLLRRSGVPGDVARLGVVAANRPHSRPLRRMDTRASRHPPHVAQVFEMDGETVRRSTATGRGHPLGVARRQHGGARRVDVGDDAQPVALVEGAGGPASGCRKPVLQAEIGVEPGPHRLGDDLARMVRGER